VPEIHHNGETGPMTQGKSLHPDKLEAILQWNNDPCGLVDGLSPDDAAYWLGVDAHRYGTYAPWMQETFGFDRFPGKRLLEIGFGLGSDLMQFVRGGCEAHGIDLTPRHVELTRRRFCAAGMRAHLTQGDAEFLPYASEAFDIVYSFGVLHHTPDMPAALSEIHRVLQPGGTLILAVYHRYSLVIAWKILVDGILRGELFKSDWRTFMSRIEQRHDINPARPLVNLYSRSDLKRLLNRFSSVNYLIRHAPSTIVRRTDNHLKAAAKRLLGRLQSCNELLSRWFGWYLIAVARK